MKAAGPLDVVPGEGLFLLCELHGGGDHFRKSHAFFAIGGDAIFAVDDQRRRRIDLIIVHELAAMREFAFDDKRGRRRIERTAGR